MDFVERLITGLIEGATLSIALLVIMLAFNGQAKKSPWLFFYLLASMGLAYWAKINRRNPLLWFGMAVICTPLLASIILYTIDRYGW